MKKSTLPLVSLLFIIFSTSIVAQTGQFKVRNDAFIQIGYNTYKTLTFGASTGSLNNGNFALEYCVNCTSAGSGGLNIWIAMANC